MTDKNNKTANQDHQVARTQSQSDGDASAHSHSNEDSITQNKTIIKPKAGQANKVPKQPAPPSNRPVANQQARVQPKPNPMPSMDEPTRLQGMDDFRDVRQAPKINQAFSAGKNMSSEFAQGLVSLPKKLITAYQTYTEENTGNNSIIRQFALVILTCIIFYVWTVFRSPLFMAPKASIESRALMVDIIELLNKGERKKANILIKKAAEVEKDEKLAKKLQSLTR